MVAQEFTLRLADARSVEAQSAMSSYFNELDTLFSDGFDPGDALTADVAAYDSPAGAFVIAESADGGVVGCGALLTFEPGVGEIKRMWVHPEARGKGLASRLLRDLEDRSRSMGHERTILDTNEVLHGAITMYERAGYTAIDRYNDNPYAHHWFEKRWPTG